MGRIKFRKISADTSEGEIFLKLSSKNLKAILRANYTVQQMTTFDEMTRNENLRKIEQLDNPTID